MESFLVLLEGENMQKVEVGDRLIVKKIQMVQLKVVYIQLF
mgnify:CR=1 FL=1